MAQGRVYCLKGYGQIQQNWVCDFFEVFKQHQVNIRKLILLKNEQPPHCFSMLELHFVLPVGETQNPFMELVHQQITLQVWDKHQLELLSS